MWVLSKERREENRDRESFEGKLWKLDESVHIKYSKWDSIDTKASRQRRRMIEHKEGNIQKRERERVNEKERHISAVNSEYSWNLNQIVIKVKGARKREWAR